MHDLRTDREAELHPAHPANGGDWEEEGSIQDDDQPRPAISIHVDQDIAKISLTEISARVLLALCDQVMVQGSSAKLQIGIAQQELEQGLEALEPSPSQVLPSGQRALPLNRAARRRLHSE